MRYTEDQMTSAFKTLRLLLVEAVTEDAMLKAKRSVASEDEKKAGVEMARACAAGAAIIAETFFTDVSRIAMALETLAQNAFLETGNSPGEDREPMSSSFRAPSDVPRG